VLLDQVVPLLVAEVTFPDFHPQAGTQGPVFAYVVRHPDAVVLVDTGIGSGSSEVDTAYQPRRRPLADALSEARLRLGDIALVVNTHLHFDHCGNNALFPNVPVYVHSAEYVAAHTQLHYTVLDWVDAPNTRYEQVSGDHELLPGLRLVPTSGHTPGHQSVLIDTDAGPVILAGQAIYNAAEYHHLEATGTLFPDTGDRTQALASAHRLLALEPRVVYFSHDQVRIDAAMA